MAKFCSNCGTPVKEGDKVCGKCGVVIQETVPVSVNEKETGKPEEHAKAKHPKKSEKPEKSENPEKSREGKKKTVNFIRLIVAAIVLVAVAVIAANIAGVFAGYNGTLKKMVKAMEDFDMAALEEMASGVSNAVYGAGYSGELSDLYEDMVSDKLDYYEDDIGPIRSIRFQITGESEFSDRRIRQAEKWLEETYDADIDKIGIRKIMALDVTLTVRGSKRTEKYYVQDLYLIRERGGWKIYYGNLEY